MESRKKENLLAWFTVLAAYGLLVAVRIVSWEFAFTYEHWIKGLDLSYLPRLTTYSLPMIGIPKGPAMALWCSPLIWLILALWPGASLVYFFRESVNSRISVLNLSLMAWMLVLSAVTILASFGLWLPFGHV